MRGLSARSAGGAVLIVGLLVAGVMFGPAPAHADFFGTVDCDQQPTHAECQPEAGTPDRPGAMEAGPAGEVVCHDADGEVVDCFVEGEGWLWSDGCRYLFVDAPPTTDADGPGASYLPTCPGDPANSQRALVWISDADAPGPAALGRIAVSRLVLPQPELELSPPLSAPQLVMLPTWLWVEPSWWVTRSASASVPGVVTVTATAQPTQVRWETGDGESYVCDEGTPYTAGGDPAAASPDCGHVYQRPSSDQPGETYALTATVTWRVSWSGGGMSGVADPLFSTTTVPVQVVESRAVNTGIQR